MIQADRFLILILRNICDRIFLSTARATAIGVGGREYAERDPLLHTQNLLRDFPPCVHAVSISPVGEILAYEVGTYTDIEEIIDDGPRIIEIGEHSKKYIDPNQPKDARRNAN